MSHFDAEGAREGEPCPLCSSTATVTYRYTEGFEELDCTVCGYSSEQEELSDLHRFGGTLLERDNDKDLPPVPVGRMRA